VRVTYRFEIKISHLRPPSCVFAPASVPGLACPATS
jgi:hypothetical protein